MFGVEVFQGRVLTINYLQGKGMKMFINFDKLD